MENFVFTWNYYFHDYNLEHKNLFEQTFESGHNWQAGTGETGAQVIICRVFINTELWEDIFNYNNSLPSDKARFFEKEVLVKEEPLDPAPLKEFFEGYIENLKMVPRDENVYHYAIFQRSINSKGEPFLFPNTPATVKVNGEIVRVSTLHSDDKMNPNRDKAEIEGNAGVSWLPIYDNMIMSIDNGGSLLFRKYFRDDEQIKLLQDIVKMCELAIKVGVEIRRNIDW